MIERIGKYEVIAELGRGGMGRVYRAHDPSVDRDVAIKVLTSDGDPDLLGRFRSEAGTTGKLNHKNIVTVHGYGEQDDMPYLVMELLQGEDLARVIRERKPLTLLEKVRIMYQVAEGLSYAHQNSVIHRDIKPANIMLLPDGTVKIMDFGIARVTSRNSTRRTQKGFLLGTISYMAPEQFRLGLDADQLVDIFAYGDVFYELITGAHPFHAEDPGTVMYRITAVDPRPVREIAPECPESLSYIIHQLLAKDRELRYQSLKDALLDIEPTLFELRQHRAGEILAEAQGLIESAQLESALIKVKEALELDPMSREARQLRDRLQQDLHRQAVRVKVTGLLEEGDAMIAQRKFGEAVQVFENALRLEKSDTVQARVDLARRELEKTQRAARLYADARREVQQGNFTGAFSIVNSAVELDPFNTEAAQFSKRLAVEIEERERERRIEAAVQSAARYVESGEFAQALEEVDRAAAELGEVPVLSEARQQIIAARLEAERRQRQRRLENTMDSVRNALQSGDLDAARSGIGILFSDFSDIREAVRRAEEFNDEVARRQHDADVAEVEQEARELARQFRFAEARSKTEAVLAKYPKDPRLQRVLEALARVQANKERADAIARAAEEIAQLEEAGRWEEALESARNALNAYRDHPPFRESVSRLENEVKQRQRAAGIADAVARGTALVDTDPSGGAAVVRAAISKFGREAELQVALAMLESALERRREQEFLEETLSRSAALRASGDWRKALDEVERALGRYPDRNELKSTASEIRAELYRQARAEKLRTTIENIEKSMQARDWRKSEQLLKTARQEFHGEGRLDELQAELERGQLADAVASLEAAVRQSFARDDLAGAGKQLSSAPGRVKSDRIWEALNVELERRKIYVGALQKAQKLVSQGQLAEAEQLLGTAVEIPVADPRAEQLLRSVKEKRARAEAEARERQEREKKEAEAREKARLEAEARERERLERERLERERKEAEAREKARLEAEARERERLERERLEGERKEAEAREKARLEAEARERERIERERLERERKEAEAREKARLEAEARKREQVERERLERERKEAEAREKARLEAEARERERIERERLERERKEAEAREKARLEAEARERERIERERRERERKEAEAREKARLEAEARERQEREQKEAEAREKARLEAEARERERVERERLERERKEAAAREKARLEAEARERERLERERLERERKEAAAREKARLEAEARERERLERERLEREKKEAAAREKARLEAEARERQRLEKERQERERKEAEARERARKEAERKAAEANKGERRDIDEKSRPGTWTEPPPPPPPGSPGIPDGQRQAATAFAGATMMLNTAEMERVLSTATSTRVATIPPPVPIYRKPVVIGPAALLIVVSAYLLLRPGTAVTNVALQPSPTEVSLHYQVGSSITPSAEVNLGKAEVPFNARSTAAWLAVDPGSGERISSVHISANPSGLKPGAYDATLEIAPSDPKRFALTNASVPVHLRISEKRVVVLRVEPTAVAFEYRDGGSIPSPKQVTVSADDLSGLRARWEDPKQATWAKFDVSDGNVRVRVQPYTGLTVGTHAAALLIEVPGASNSPQRVGVSLKVSSGLGLGLP